MDKSRKAQWEKHFAILREAQTWKNLIYLLLAFPLGIAYFVISVTGLAAGVPLMIIWIGFFILFALHKNLRRFLSFVNMRRLKPKFHILA